jgi:hypothetical protein
MAPSTRDTQQSMDRCSSWVEGQITDHQPDRSDNKQSVVVLADACAALSGKGGQLFGMSMPPLPDAAALYARACVALAAWFPRLDPDEAEQLAARIQQQGLDVPIPASVTPRAAAPSAVRYLAGRDPHETAALAALCDRMHAEREESLRRFGEVMDGVLARVRPIVIADTTYPWPANLIGAQRLVRTEDSVLLVTDGLSNPWDPSLHADVPDWTFGFELAVEIPLSAFKDTSDEAIAASWAPLVLWAATDWVVAERTDILGRLGQYEVCTHAIPPIVGLEHLVANTGFMGGLIGIPFVGDTFGASVGHGHDPYHPGVMTCLLTLKLLTADEYEWSMGVRDSSRAVALAELFLERGERHLSWPNRPSVVGKMVS